MSESSASPPTCPVCGAALPATQNPNLCPRCLMAEVMASTGDGARTAPVPPRALPVAELAPHFPQLEVLECIGRGGMGVVYKARQKALNRVVALKLLAPGQEKEESFAARFTREAQALATLSHPNIVTIYDFGEAGGFYYLLMEYIDGVNLRQAMKAGRFTPEQALAIVPPVCEALQYAHEHGVVHRDIKPENLLLDKEGRVKIADFGIAKMLDTTKVLGQRLGTAAGTGDPGGSQPVGTPQYMAPEQKDHHTTDHRADIYSLGVVLYELLTGELPADRLQPPSRKVTIDVRLDEIVLRALERTPELRYQTAGEFRTQVEMLAARRAGVPTEHPRADGPETPPPATLAETIGCIPWTLWLVIAWFAGHGTWALIDMALHTSWYHYHLNLMVVNLAAGLGLLTLRSGWWRFAIILNSVQSLVAALGLAYLVFVGKSRFIMPMTLGGLDLVLPVALLAAITGVVIHLILIRLRSAGLFHESRRPGPDASTSIPGFAPVQRRASWSTLAFIAMGIACMSGLIGTAAWTQMPHPSQVLVWSILGTAVLGLILALPVWRTSLGKQALIVALLNIAIWLIIAFAFSFRG